MTPRLFKNNKFRHLATRRNCIDDVELELELELEPEKVIILCKNIKFWENTSLELCFNYPCALAGHQQVIP